MFKSTPRIIKILLGLVALALLAVALYFVPPIHSRLAWRLDNLQTSIYYIVHPPQNVVFVPTQQSLLTQPVALPTASPTAAPILTLAAATPTPTFNSTPIPPSVILNGVTFVDQMHRWNYCGPANLTMALEYWGWKGEPGSPFSDIRDQVAAVVKPGIDDPNLDSIQKSNTDVNVMPYEMVDYVNNHTDLKALYRYGGDLNLLKQLIAAGFPVIAEKGIYQTLPPENTMQWAGHYAFTTGYDDSQQVFIWQDSYTPDETRPYKDQGFNVQIRYSDYTSTWRAFDYVFIVVYPPDREAELLDTLGTWADETWSARHALETAVQETQSLTGIDQFFAWFNKGTSSGLLTDYGQAALAFDQAFGLYNKLPKDGRPYRIMWYETGPYKAYFYTSRYQDVINLADNTLQTIKAPRSLEESLYWRAMAEATLSEFDKAYADLRTAYHLNRRLQATIDLMAQWGISP
jgi:tetratricopeptide (TPR) repeat protein